MKYMNGIEVMVGDIVAVAHGDQGEIEGVVLEVLLPGTPDAEERSLPEGGVLIEGGGLGLFIQLHLEEAEDIVFIRRASSKP